MPRCARNGYLVDTTHPLPTDPTEHDVAYLPTIGCSRLKCLRCGASVRVADGVAFKTRDDVATATLAALYQLPDLLESGMLHKTNEAWRLYLCRCDRYLATGEDALETDDPDDSPSKPWQCDEHPLATMTVDVARDLTRRGLRGDVPADVREVDRENNAWLLRLYNRLEPASANAMAEAAREGIDDADVAVRSASLRFLFFTGTDAMREAVAAALQAKPALFTVPIDVGLHKLDTTLQDTAWHVVSKSLGHAGPARDYARSEALSGHGTRALYGALAEYDADWLLANLEAVARSTPGRGAELIASFHYLPETLQGDHADRVRGWLIPPTAPLDAIRKAAKDHVTLVRRDVPLEGAMKPIKLALPDLEDGTTLELEITAPGSEGRERLLDLRIRTAAGTVTRRLARGSKIELITRLQASDIADRIVFQSLEVRR